VKNVTAARVTDGRLVRGDKTRAAVLARAADIASVEGLEGLSIGQLATELNISKSGVFAHFGSKEELQLATVSAAADVFIEHVIAPAMQTPPGVRRVWRLLDHWLDYSQSGVFSGGCFFISTAAEFDSRPGRVRDAIASMMKRWVDGLAQEIRGAIKSGEVEPTADPAQLAFELDALISAANASYQLLDDPVVFRRARAGVLARLRMVATDPTVLPKRP
jgi:AcrR family transcriptional regulator